MYKLVHSRAGHVVIEITLVAFALIALWEIFRTPIIMAALTFIPLIVIWRAQLRWQLHMEPCRQGKLAILGALDEQIRQLRALNYSLVLPPSGSGICTQLNLKFFYSGSATLIEEQNWGDDDYLQFTLYRLTRYRAYWCQSTVRRPISGPLNKPVVHMTEELPIGRALSLLNKLDEWERFR